MADIKIDVSDWVDEANREEVEFGDSAAMLAEHVKNAWTPTKTGRLAIAARHLNRAPSDILPENKLLLMSGAAVAVVQAFQRKFHTVKIGDTDRDVRDWVGGVANEETLDTFVLASSEEAIGRAKDYLDKIVPGHIWGRMVILAENGIPLSEVAEALKARIDEMVNRIEAVKA